MPIQLPQVTIIHTSFSLTIQSIALGSGEVLGIFGKSGAGKTSYLRQIHTVSNPETVHYMSQFDTLLEELTVQQNIELGFAAYNKKHLHTAAWVQEHGSILDDFEVTQHLGKYPRQLSGGQRKRCELVRALILNPKLLLLDEPFQGIGHIFESIARDYITKRKAQAHSGTLVVSHDLEFLQKFCDRVLLLDDEGVIEIIPTNDPGWKPSSIRTAWSMGIDTVLPSAVVRSLTEAKFNTESEHIGLWPQKASWESAENAEITLNIPENSIVSKRSYTQNGDLYTEIHIQLTPHATVYPVISKGLPAAGKPYMVYVSEYLPLN